MTQFSNKTEILDFIKLFMHGAVNEASINDIYTDVMKDIAQGILHPLVGWVEEDTEAGEHTYKIPSAAIKVLAVFHKLRQLSFVNVPQLETYNINWRTETGDPIAYLQQEQDAKKIRLFPEPISGLTFQEFEFIDTNDFIFQDMVDVTWQQTVRLKELIFLFSELRETNVPEWATLFLLFETLARETAQPGIQQDIAFSSVCQTMAKLLATF